MENVLWLLLAVQVVSNLLLIVNVVSMRKSFKESRGSYSYSERAIIDNLRACEGAIRQTANSVEGIKEHMEASRLEAVKPYDLSMLNRSLDRIQRSISEIKLNESAAYASKLKSIDDNLDRLCRTLSFIQEDLGKIEGYAHREDPEDLQNRLEEERYIKGF